MKIFVTGASGLLGSKILEYGRAEHEMIGSYLSHKIEVSNVKTVKMDIRDETQAKTTINLYRPDVIIHAAALTNVDYCETHHEEAYITNVLGTKNIAIASERIGCKLVYVSTAGIFDGKNAPYDESAIPNPPNYYAKTKLEGEKIVSRISDNSIIVRTTVPYGWHSWKLNFVTWIIKNLQQRKPVRIVTDQRNTPTYANDFAKAVLKLIELNQKGIFNVVGPTSISRYDFALKIAEIFELEKKYIVPISTSELGQIAKRPTDDSLKINKILKLGIKMSTVDEGLLKMKREKDEGRASSWWLRN